MSETYTFADPNMTEDGETGDDFDRWIHELDEEVIQGEYGYEQGEFTVFPTLWWTLYHKRKTPKEAWLVALEEHKAARTA